MDKNKCPKMKIQKNFCETFYFLYILSLFELKKSLNIQFLIYIIFELKENIYYF
jgi:hypothetical protein